MKTLWKVLLGLLLVVPLGGYVAGSLAASASEGQQPRHTIRISEPDPAPTARPTHGSTDPSTGPSPHDDGDDDADDDGDDDGDDEVEVIVPEYDDLGDDHDGDDHGDDSDHSGHGGED